MKHFILGVALSLSTATVLGSGSVNAASESEARECACVLAQNSDVSAQLSEIKGSVLATTPAGFTPVTEPVGLTTGSRVVVSSQSSAKLSVGPTCHQTLQANQEAEITSLNGQMCVKVSSLNVEPALFLGDQEILGFPTFGPLAFGGAVLAATLITLIALGDDNPAVDPVTPQ